MTDNLSPVKEESSSQSTGEYKSKESGRNSSIELLRIFSVFLIVMMHACALLDWESTSIANKVIIGVINSIGNIGVSCFIFISGYFGVKFNWRKFTNLIVLTTIYCTVVAWFKYGYAPVQLVKAFLTVPTYSNWFIICYLFLMVLSPYLNRFLSTLDKKEYKNLILISILLLCVLPTLSLMGATNDIILRQGGKNLVYFIFLYIVGRYIRLHNDREYNRWQLWGGHFICTVLILGLNILGSYILHVRFISFRFDCSPLILMSSLCVFYLFKSWNYQSRIIDWLSSSVFAFYLLSNIFYYINNKAFHLETYSTDDVFPILLMGLVVSSFVFSIVVDKTFGGIMNRLLSYFEDRIELKRNRN